MCAAKNWVDPGERKRKRQVNYSENDFFRNQMKPQGRAPGGPRLPKMPPLQDFQFYDLPRLTALYDQEQAYELFKYQQGQKESNARQQVSLQALRRCIYSCLCFECICGISLSQHGPLS